MSDIAIRVENLSKQYKIGVKPPDRLKDLLTSGLNGLFSRSPVYGSPSSDGSNSQSEIRNPKSEYIWALKDVSFEVKQGETLGIIGRNGAGKSTLLKILSRITEPTCGRAAIYGRVGSLLEVGTGFDKELTGRENIFLNGAVLGMTKREIDSKFDEIVDFSGVEQFIDTPVKRYSSGMYVRLAFAVAAHLEPEILVVDEVLSVGDASFQKKCVGKMDDAARQGRTVLFVSHNMAAISHLCQRGIWLDEGIVKKEGLSQDVVETYLSSQNTQIAERLWAYPGDAPGDELVRLLAGRVLQNGKRASVVDINVPCQIELEFAVLQPVHNLVTGVNLYNAQGICIFSNCDWRPNKLTPGKYQKRVTVPGQLLAEGHTSVLLQLIFYDPDIQSVVYHNALGFDAIDSDHPLSVRGLYKRSWPGIIRVFLKWTEAMNVSDCSHLEDELVDNEGRARLSASKEG